MPSSMYRPLAFFLAAAALLSLTDAAAPPAGDFCASQWLPKGATGVNGTHVLGVHDTSDGCPVGWVECSAYTCYPLDGSTCCSDGNFCQPGYYCDSGGCCPNGKVCDGAAPPPSTINGGTFTSSTARATTPVTTPRTSTAVTATFSTALPPPASSTVSVGFSAPVQSTDFGTVPANTPTLNTVIPTLATTVGSSSPTSGIGLRNGAAPLDARAGVWLAGLVAVAVCIA